MDAVSQVSLPPKRIENQPDNQEKATQKETADEYTG
jgi:hypothetical protein